ncbi:M20 aminoacylase family protein [Marinibacterium profundimaris]|uniref:Amidohydrolase n=1 Tax=Marinibacterium profundimaris TaxID=1679460 RepID=A0A225NP46_9RHOB|nr:M20 aminoacylase family protein [Marinibacterium profundimaris]OWU76049.1 amidohydrolase [Marinibacterium profundimaris]
MTVLAPIADAAPELEAIFKDLHAHPELGFQEERTSAVVAETLKAYGVDEIHRGLGKTGVVALIHGREKGNRRVGLRADMDALPIDEITGLDYASKTPGVMHACGHDGHTTMLLGAAKYLAQTRDFAGTAVLIFQPAEEGLGGARQMLADGLFEQFPCDEIYGMHNAPGTPPGKVGICKGAAMAGAAFFDIRISGRGSHAAAPHMSKDALMIAATLAGQIQTILSRNIPPQETCVLSITQLHAGSAYNVVPETATLAGTIRYFSDDIYKLAGDRMQAICDGFAKAHDVEIALDLRNVFDVLQNDEELSDAYIDAAADIVGAENVSNTEKPVTGSEDFADMLQAVPGAYVRVGHGGTVSLHNPAYVLDPAILPVGASIMARVVEKRLPVGG